MEVLGSGCALTARLSGIHHPLALRTFWGPSKRVHPMYVVGLLNLVVVVPGVWSLQT